MIPDFGLVHLNKNIFRGEAFPKRDPFVSPGFNSATSPTLAGLAPEQALPCERVVEQQQPIRAFPRAPPYAPMRRSTKPVQVGFAMQPRVSVPQRHIRRTVLQSQQPCTNLQVVRRYRPVFCPRVDHPLPCVGIDDVVLEHDPIPFSGLVLDVVPKAANQRDDPLGQLPRVAMADYIVRIAVVVVGAAQTVLVGKRFLDPDLFLPAGLTRIVVADGGSDETHPLAAGYLHTVVPSTGRRSGRFLQSETLRSLEQRVGHRFEARPILLSLRTRQRLDRLYACGAKANAERPVERGTRIRRRPGRRQARPRKGQGGCCAIFVPRVNVQLPVGAAQFHTLSRPRLAFDPLQSPSLPRS